jgi:hypothetical protein
VGVTAILDEASLGDNSVGAAGVVCVFTGLLLLFAQEFNNNIETNASINKIFMVIPPDDLIQNYDCLVT